MDLPSEGKSEGKKDGVSPPERRRPPKPIPMNPPMTRSALLVGAVILATWLIGKGTVSCRAPDAPAR